MTSEKCPKCLRDLTTVLVDCPQEESFAERGISCGVMHYESVCPSCPLEEDAVLRDSSDTTPEHYRGQLLQPWDVIAMFGLDFWEGNVLKYLLRWRKKNGLEDLKKARHYLDDLIERQGDDTPFQGFFRN